MVRNILGIGRGNEIATFLARPNFFLLEGCSNIPSLLGCGFRHAIFIFSAASLLEFLGKFSAKFAALPREI